MNIVRFEISMEEFNFISDKFKRFIKTSKIDLKRGDVFVLDVCSDSLYLGYSILCEVEFVQNFDEFTIIQFYVLKY